MRYPPFFYAKFSDTQKIDRIIGKKLKPRQRRVLFLRFVAGRTYEQIGARIGVTRERVRQIESKVIRVIKGNLIIKDKKPEIQLSVRARNVLLNFAKNKNGLFYSRDLVLSKNCGYKTFREIMDFMAYHRIRVNYTKESPFCEQCREKARELMRYSV